MNMNIIGTIYNRDGEYDADGNVITPPTAKPGYHVNTTEPVPEWGQWRVEPTTPHRVYQGLPTYSYRFDDEAQFVEQRVAVFGEPEA